MTANHSMNAMVAGVHMVPFKKPGQQRPFRVMGAEAILGALNDAGLDSRDIQQAYASYGAGDTGCGQHALYDAFQTGIPVFNVNNACCSGSSALFLARQAVLSGQVDCALAFGFEEMPPGAIETVWNDREGSRDRIDQLLDAQGVEPGPLAPRWFGAAGRQYLDRYDATPELFAQVAVKTRKHAQANPLALFRTPITVEEVMASPMIYGGYLTKLMCCPPSCGAAAAIIVSERFAKKRGITHGVEMIAQVMATDTEASWQDPMHAVGKEMVSRAAQQVYEEAGIGPNEVDVIELHDCFTPNEILTYENLGLCEEGGASRLVADGDNTYGGQWVVNPSGGLMSKGHPVGATGLAQCTELVKQLRGQAEQRQVPGARIGLQHNIGLVAGVIVTLYRKQ